MIDDNNSVWELVKRDDLNKNNLNEELEQNSINSVIDFHFSELTNSIINLDVHKKANSIQISNEDFLMNKYSGYINELNEFIGK